MSKTGHKKLKKRVHLKIVIISKKGIGITKFI